MHGRLERSPSHAASSGPSASRSLALRRAWFHLENSAAGARVHNPARPYAILFPEILMIVAADDKRRLQAVDNVPDQPPAAAIRGDDARAGDRRDARRVVRKEDERLRPVPGLPYP